MRQQQDRLNERFALARDFERRGRFLAALDVYRDIWEVLDPSDPRRKEVRSALDYLKQFEQPPSKPAVTLEPMQWRSLLVKAWKAGVLALLLISGMMGLSLLLETRAQPAATRNGGTRTPAPALNAAVTPARVVSDAPVFSTLEATATRIPSPTTDATATSIPTSTLTPSPTATLEPAATATSSPTFTPTATITPSRVAPLAPSPTVPIPTAVPLRPPTPTPTLTPP